jgi:hypothetical protein
MDARNKSGPGVYSNRVHISSKTGIGTKPITKTPGQEGDDNGEGKNAPTPPNAKKDSGIPVMDIFSVTLLRNNIAIPDRANWVASVAINEGIRK